MSLVISSVNASLNYKFFTSFNIFSCLPLIFGMSALSITLNKSNYLGPQFYLNIQLMLMSTYPTHCSNTEKGEEPVKSHGDYISTDTPSTVYTNVSSSRSNSDLITTEGALIRTKVQDRPRWVCLHYRDPPFLPDIPRSSGTDREIIDSRSLPPDTAIIVKVNVYKGCI